MQTYIAILRGINVSGQKMINMELLKAHMKELGFKNIETYIQSGNIIFDYENINSIDLAKQIEVKILEKYGFQVPVIVRTPPEFDQIINNNPFLNSRKEDINKLHVTFLSSIPAQEQLNKFPQIENIADEFEISGDRVFIFCPNGYGNTKLNNNFFENKLKVICTTRNWKTVIKLAEMSKNRGLL
jgi:uncharacterized protein (DUF1697 family)